MQAERILRGMHMVYSHDLPNQVVVLQSLLQMLELDESANLSPDGCEYLRRLQNATRRTADMARFLKEMGRLASYQARLEEVSLSVLAREIQGALKQQFPDRAFAFDWQWPRASILADYRTLLHGLIELVTWAVTSLGGDCLVHGTSTVQGMQVALLFVLEKSADSDDRAGRKSVERNVPVALDLRMEINLARECLAVSQASLEIPSAGPGRYEFSIVLPTR